MKGELLMKGIVFKVEEELHQSLKSVAALQNTSMQELLQRLVINYLDKHSKLLPEDLQNYIHSLLSP